MNVFLVLVISVLLSPTSFALSPNCTEIASAASSLAQLNYPGATVAPAYRLPPTATMTARGAEFGYEYDVLWSAGDELPNRNLGSIQVVALIKAGETKCRVSSLLFNER